MPDTSEEHKRPIPEELTEKLGLTEEEVRQLLEKAAPVRVEEGERTRVYARPSTPDALPAPTRKTRRQRHRDRIDQKFIQAERVERWTLRLVMIAIFAITAAHC